LVPGVPRGGLCGLFSLFVLNGPGYTANSFTGGADREVVGPLREFWELFSGKGFSIMFRKVAIAVGAVLLGMVVVCYTSLPSLIHVKWNDSMAWLDRQVPIETQIKQIKLESEKIDTEIKHNIDKLASMEVQTMDLEQHVVALKEDQAGLKKNVARLHGKLEGNLEKVALRDRTAMVNELDLLVSSYEVKNEKLKSMESLLFAKRQTLEAAHQKIGAMKDQRDQLRISIAKLESRKELVDIKSQQCQVQISDSKINEINALLKKVNDRLNEQETKAALYSKYGYSEAPAVADTTAKNATVVLDHAKKVLASEEQDDK
jgi:phage shock protein A